ncbi:hypothetical protein [Nonomuraea aurantiaca]|jgi:hypothetical protein|uniref:hypothetical protein n=1 Tax=Nonomuraea aurantiaca TaxID=2878562 RepID=UPI001CD93F0D|nr:hypothetical protein [Nonomuraea aurantiaca]MCA2230328.1 hypothetical protein [Nonomuraea aurantiaca]
MTIVQIKITIQRVRLGASEFRVSRPAKPLANGALYDTGIHYHMYVDRTDGRRIGALWLLAVRSPRSLAYLPMRATPAASGINPDWDKEERCPDRPLDLVVVHHSLQFPPPAGSRYDSGSPQEALRAKYGQQVCRTPTYPPMKRLTTGP